MAVSLDQKIGKQKPQYAVTLRVIRFPAKHINVHKVFLMSLSSNATRSSSNNRKKRKSNIVANRNKETNYKL